MGATVGIGRGHSTADLFRTTYQDPLHKRVAGIVDPLGEKRNAGTLTYEEALAGQTKLEAALAEFEKDAGTFSGLGGENATVVSQARKTLDPIIANWRKTFAEDLARLPKPAPAKEEKKISEEAPTRESILGGITPQKKRQPAADKRQTILGGYGEGRQERKTLLGY